MPEPSPTLAQLELARKALQESLNDLERAIEECQRAKQESLETLAELDEAIRRSAEEAS